MLLQWGQMAERTESSLAMLTVTPAPARVSPPLLPAPSSLQGESCLRASVQLPSAPQHTSSCCSSQYVVRSHPRGSLCEPRSHQEVETHKLFQ